MYKIYSVDYKQIEEDLVELSLFERIAKLGEKFTLKLKTTVSLTSLIESKVSVIKQAEQTLNLPNRLLMVKEAIREYTQKQLEELFVEDETVTETKWYNGQDEDLDRIIYTYLLRQHPELCEYSFFDCIKVQYELDYNSWRVHCTKDFTVQGKEIKADTIGGLVSTPFVFFNRPSWVEDGVIFKHQVILDNSYLTNGFKAYVSTFIINSYLDSEVESCRHTEAIINSVRKTRKEVMPLVNADAYIIASEYKSKAEFIQKYLQALNDLSAN